ncbi:MAG: ImmA/IrrE family metallo-endopeptidase [Butyrivibrio sp.]|nr:ImmA/IrrE family metallo-endopeptidase [Acetatifactor muris]MCM1561220.1 ImmA/IrrE family metallo-endopeptidase [Butyrivibrio sp.]
MTTYEQLLAEADNNNLIAKEKDLPISKGRIKGNRIAISKALTEQAKKCVMAEELGHYYTGVGDILDQSSVSNRKQELRGRLWAYNRLIGLRGIISAHESGCRNITDIADYLDVTESFLREALICYKQKYGLYVKLDNYIIYFEPGIGVCEMNGDAL